MVFRRIKMAIVVANLAALGLVHAADAQWTLSTDDTCLKLSVSHDKVFIDALKNPAQDWNWTPVASQVPLPGKNCIKP